MTPLSKTRLDMIEAGGRLCQLLGVPRSTGQIYGLLYLWPRPLPLDDIAKLLGISKASVSLGTRQLLSWRAIRQVWVQGERRDYFEVEPDLGRLLRAGFTDFLKPRLHSSHQRIAKMSSILEEERAQGILTDEEYKLCSGRLKGFVRIQKKLQTLAPLAERLL
jgi:DNA-binding transcriptional regulator GbsR (MarR family)